MQHHAITLADAALPPLRAALYSRLAETVNTLDGLLGRADRETSTTTHDTYKQLHATAELLDRIGWQDHEPRSRQLDITTPQEARLIIDALRAELQVEQEQAADHDRYAEPDMASRSRERAHQLRDVLDATEAAAAAGLHATATSGRADSDRRP